MRSIIRKFFNGPLILVNVVTQTNFGIDIVSKQINISLVLWTSVQRWELEKCFFYTTVVINVDGIFEHVVNEIRIWFDKIVKRR